MRELLNDLLAGRGTDPMEAARRAMRPPQRRRFYKQAKASETDEGFAILLDGRAVRTPGRRILAAPTRALAEAIAAEWEAQQEVIDPMRMPLTRLANAIIDGVIPRPEPVAAEIAKYLGSDLICYRAPSPRELTERQQCHWDPLLRWAREELGARFVLVEGMVHVAQPETTLAAARKAIPDDPWRLGAVHSITTLTGSALIALAVARGRLSAEEAWTAAHVDEDWNMEQWGRDELAVQRRAFHLADFQAAVRMLQALERWEP
jgi:chaperone required for assembly of F1-ATPase